MIAEVLPPVNRSQRPSILVTKEREMQVIDMEVQYVKILNALAYLVEHDHIVGNWVADIWIEAQGPSTAGD